MANAVNRERLSEMARNKQWFSRTSRMHKQNAGIKLPFQRIANIQNKINIRFTDGV